MKDWHICNGVIRPYPWMHCSMCSDTISRGNFDPLIEFRKLRSENTCLTKSLKHAKEDAEARESENEELKKQEKALKKAMFHRDLDWLGQDIRIAQLKQQVERLREQQKRARIAAMTCKATLKLILQDTQEGATATHLKPAIENLEETTRELEEK